MALTFAGQPLVVVSPELRQKVEGMLSTLDLYETARLHWVANEAFPSQFGVSVDHHIEIGKLFWPAGASRWASGHFLVHQTEAEAIVAACWPDSSTYTSAELEMTWEEPEYENGVEGEPSVVDSISATMYPLPLRPIETDESEGLYLLTLVDQRFFWWSKNTGAFHVTPGVTTWTDLWGSFGGFVGVGSVTVDSPVAAYLKPSRLLDLSYEAVPAWWDSAANSVGQRVVVSLDGSIYVQSPYTTGPSETEGVLAGGDFLGEVQLSQAPLTATCLFSDLSGGYVAKSHSGAGAIGEVVLQTFILADQQTSGEMQAYADQWAADFDAWQQGDSDVKLAGIVNVEPNGTYGNIIWTYRRDELSTRVQPADYVERSLPLSNNVSNISSKICVSTSAKATNSQNTTTTVVVGLGLSSRICVSACLKATRDQISSPSIGLGISSKICVSACLKASWGQATGGVNHQTGTTYTVDPTDNGGLVTRSNGSGMSDTLPQAGTTGFPYGYTTSYQNLGTGTVTITPTTSTINGASTLTLPPNTGATIFSDGTNYSAQTGGASVSVSSVASTVSASSPDGDNTTYTTLFDISSSGLVVGYFSVVNTGPTYNLDVRRTTTFADAETVVNTATITPSQQNNNNTGSISRTSSDTEEFPVVGIKLEVKSNNASFGTAYRARWGYFKG